MKVVSNTGPLIGLAKINQLSLLEVRNHGYWLSDEVIEVAGKLAGEYES